MDKKMNAIVFPYDFEFLPVVKNRHLLNNIDIKYLVAPSGFGLENKDAYYFDNSEELGFIIKSQISDECFENIDVVWITESIQKVEFNNIKDLIEKIGKHNKNIIYTVNSGYIYKEEIYKLCKANNVKIITTKDYIKDFNMVDCNKIEPSFALAKINTPIITVLGMSPMTQKFDLQLHLRNKFLQNEYKVSQIGTKALGETMGFYSIPDWFFSNKYKENEKILMFNKFVHEIEKNENPDVIIIGVPDCIMPLTKNHNFNYGIYAFEIYNAINSDFTILSLLDGLYNDEFFDEMKSVCNYRFNVELDGFFTSKYRPVSNSLDQIKLSFTHTNGTKNSSEKYNVFNAEDLKNNSIINEVIKKLSMYSVFEVL